MRNFYKSQIILILFSWLMVLAYLSLGGIVFSSSFKIFVGFYLAVPGFIALFFAKKEKITIPIFKLEQHKLTFVLPLALLTVLLATIFSLPFCQFRSVAEIGGNLPSFFRGFGLTTTFLLLLFCWFTLGLFLSAFIFMLGLFGQELMYRGYVWEKLKVWGFWRGSWAIGLLWGIWMSPLMFIGLEYPGSHLLAIGIKIVFCMLFSPILIYLRIITKGVFIPAFFYGLMHHLSNFFSFVFIPSGYFFLGMQGLTGISSLLFINLILFLKTRKTPLLEYEL